MISLSKQGKSRDLSTRLKISTSRKGKCLGNENPAKREDERKILSEKAKQREALKKLNG